MSADAGASSDPGGGEAGPARGWLPRIGPDERRRLLWSFLAFFVLLTAYYITRPMREARALGVGVEYLAHLQTGSFVTLLVTTPLWGWLVARVPRRVLLPAVFRFFALNLVIFFVLFGRTQHWGPAAAFYVWNAVFGVMVVAVFWAFMSDIWPTETGKRVFGLIAAGGSVGAIAGPALTTVLVKLIGPGGLLLLAAGLLEVVVLCLRRAARWRGELDGVTPDAKGTPDRSPEPASADETPVGGSVWGGAKGVWHSPLLRAAALFMLLLTFSGTLNYFLQARLISREAQGQVALTGLFARLDLITNVLTAIAQGLVAGPLLTRFGVMPALLAVPLVSLVGFGITGVAPVLAVAAGMLALRRALGYGLITPAYGVLFTQVSREEKYKARAFIDTVVWRGGDLVAGWTFTAILALGTGLRGPAALGALLALPWLVVAFALARRAPSAGRPPPH